MRPLSPAARATRPAAALAALALAALGAGLASTAGADPGPVCLSGPAVRPLQFGHLGAGASEAWFSDPDGFPGRVYTLGAPGAAVEIAAFHAPGPGAGPCAGPWCLEATSALSPLSSCTAAHGGANALRLRLLAGPPAGAGFGLAALPR